MGRLLNEPPKGAASWFEFGLCLAFVGLLLLAAALQMTDENHNRAVGLAGAAFLLALSGVFFFVHWRQQRRGR